MSSCQYNEADAYEASLEEEQKYIESLVEEYEKSLECDSFVPEQSDDTFTIIVFDDGNERYKDCKNEWSLSGRWRGKISLVNKADPGIKIDSISAWKVSN